MKKYFTHIEGLRGVAILLVILYHLMPNICPSGYYGVDIFLMISGYFLISGLLKDDGKNFNIIEFTQKKLSRIFPPLLLMVIAMLTLALWVMAGSELYLAAKTAFFSLCGYCNIFLDTETQGYFAGNSARNPFLHTWYLAVLLQVYCLFALITFTLRPFSRKIKWGAYLTLGAISLGVVIYHRFILPYFQPHESMTPMYYWTWSRIFEVVAGAAILLLPKIRYRIFRNILIPIGMLLVLYCCFFPGRHIILIIPASTLLLWGATEAETSRILDNRILRFFGKHSFSLYLWHWPIIVYINYIKESPTYISIVVICIAFILLGIASWHLTEKKRWRLCLTAPTWGLCLFLAYHLSHNSYISRRIHPHVYAATDAVARCVQPEVCPDYPDYGYKLWLSTKNSELTAQKQKFLLRLGSNSKRPSFLMMGDSHASSFVPGMAEIATRLNISGYYLPVYTTPFHNRMCGRQVFRFDNANAQACMEWLSMHPEIHSVVLIQRWSIRLTSLLHDESMPLHYNGNPVSTNRLYNNTEQALIHFCERLKSLGKQVIIMTEVPSVTTSPNPYIRRALLHNHTIDTEKLTCSMERYYQYFGDHLNTFSKLEESGLCKVIPIHQALMKHGIFCAYENGKVLMDDTNHISALGAILYAQEHYTDWAPLLSTQKKSLESSHP